MYLENKELLKCSEDFSERIQIRSIETRKYDTQFAQEKPTYNYDSCIDENCSIESSSEHKNF